MVGAKGGPAGGKLMRKIVNRLVGIEDLDRPEQTQSVIGERELCYIAFVFPSAAGLSSLS